MTPEFIIDLFRSGMYLVAILVAVIVIPGLIVGLIIAMFQAATQINEASLSFVPKVFVTLLALGIAGPWLLKMLVHYTRLLIEQIPYVIG